MFSFFKSKYSLEEKALLYHYSKLLRENIGTSIKEADSIAKKILDEAIEGAEKENLRGVSDLGDIYIKDQLFLDKRVKVGLTIEDVKKFWNRNYVILLIEDKLANVIRFMVYKQLLDEGKSSGDVILKLRKTFIYFGEPEKSHPNFQKEDANIYREFTARYEKWRAKYTPEQEQKIAQNYSTYNAMVRDLIKKGEI